MYKDKTTGKRLVIYPSEGLADNGRNKYYKECVEKCVENNIYASQKVIIVSYLFLITFIITIGNN